MAHLPNWSRLCAAEVQGIDPSEGQLPCAGASAARVAHQTGDAMALPFPMTVRCSDYGARHIFVPTPAIGVAEMVRW